MKVIQGRMLHDGYRVLWYDGKYTKHDWVLVLDRGDGTFIVDYQPEHCEPERITEHERSNYII